MQRRSQPTYHLNTNPKIRLWNCGLGYASNVRVVHTSKLMEETSLKKTIGFDKSYLSDFELKNKNSNNKSAIINEKTENDFKCIEKLCDPCIENKYTKIV